MAARKGIPHIALEYCKGCGLCVWACPESVLTISTDTITVRGYHPAVVENPERCIGCISCALMCPDTAIVVERLSVSGGG